MNKSFRRGRVAAALLAGLAGTAVPGLSQACSAEDYISTVCIMAAMRTDLRNYQLANGASLPVQQYAALYSLIGTTYGGDASSFKVPDLRGKVIVGAGTAADGTVYPLGGTGGAKQVQLNVLQLPAHTHLLAGASLDLSTLTASTDLSKATGGSSSTSLNGIAFSASGAGLVLNANNAAAGTGSPGGAALAVPASPTNKIYSSTPPNVAMMAGLISGSVSGTLSGSAPTTLGGVAPTTFAGTAAVSGSTSATGGNQPVATMPPYVALYYYIATQGLYPDFNN